MPQLLIAASAQNSAAGVQCAALRAGDVHRSREPACDEGGPAENGNGYGYLSEGGSHRWIR